MTDRPKEGHREVKLLFQESFQPFDVHSIPRKHLSRITRILQTLPNYIPRHIKYSHECYVTSIRVADDQQISPENMEMRNYSKSVTFMCDRT